MIAKTGLAQINFSLDVQSVQQLGHLKIKVPSRLIAYNSSTSFTGIIYSFYRNIRHFPRKYHCITKIYSSKYVHFSTYWCLYVQLTCALLHTSLVDYTTYPIQLHPTYSMNAKKSMKALEINNDPHCIKNTEAINTKQDKCTVLMYFHLFFLVNLNIHTISGASRMHTSIPS